MNMKKAGKISVSKKIYDDKIEIKFYNLGQFSLDRLMDINL